MIHTLGTEFVNFYLVEEDGRFTLVDAGVSGYRSLLDTALAGLGHSIDGVTAIVLTHADSDHTGFAGELARTRGIPVYVHEADAQRTRQGRQKPTEGTPLMLLGMLRHRHCRRALGHLVKRGGAKQLPISDVVTFSDGAELDVPGRLRAVHTPGHTDGHCVLVAPADRALLVGDALNNISITTGEAGPRVPPTAANTSTAQAYASLAKIEAIDADTIYFGHGDPLHRAPSAVVAEARARR